MAILTPVISPSDTPEPTFTATFTVPPEPVSTLTPTVTPSLDEVRFAVIGDYGMNNNSEADVSHLIHSWSPDFIITLGDNNYPSGSADTIDANIGKYFHDYIYPYNGKYGAGSEINRFFPSLGNHDWLQKDAQPYLDYFTLPGNERYYDFTRGPVHFFAVDSDELEPDGVGVSSVQAAWLKQGLQASTSPWNVVYFHHPPYSSSHHGSTDWMRWPFEKWGANVVMAGHDHNYERLLVDNIPYFVNGSGGGSLYVFRDILPESQVAYNRDYGAMLVIANTTEMKFEFITRFGKTIDTTILTKP